MNAINEQILKAVEIIAEEKISKLKYDKTVQGTIYNIINLDTGEYKVEYNGNIFSAFAADIKQTYKEKDEVYVNVPEGNFSGRKIIVSKVSTQSLTQNQLMTLKNSIFEISPSFETIYDIQFKQPVGVIAGETSEASICSIDSNNNALFLQYAKNHEYIRIKGSFLTQFHDIHTKGNYGLEVMFYTNDNSEVAYRLDLENFNGSPYSFSVYSEQQIILKVQKGYLLGLKSIKLFEEHFNYDKSYTYELDTDNQIVTVAHENKSEPNIFVKDISIQYVDVKDLSESNYYLIISPIKGIAFNNTVTSLSFLGRLVYEGKDIIDKADEVQWYKRNLAVMVGHSSYDKRVGPGWEKITSADNPNLDISSTQVKHQQQYKLLAVYKDIVLTAETEVFNLNSKIEYDLEVVPSASNETTKLRITNSALVGNWYMLYPDGTYQAVSNGIRVNAIDISEYLKYSTITFYVEVLTDLGVAEYTITNSEEKSDLMVTYTGEDLFRYDANGDITIEDSEKEHTLQALLAWKEGQATNYILSWVMKDGTIIPRNKNQAINPTNSMLCNLWVDNYNILHYNLRQKYKVDLNNNTISIKIQTYTNNNKTYYFEKEILCLKDGDQGTNGTTYVTAIRPCDASGVKLSGFQALRYNNGWKNNIQLRCYVYKDGELINHNSKYNLSFKWIGYNILINGESEYSGAIEQITATGNIAISNTSNANSLTFYVKVQVDIEDNGKKVSIYTSYPINVLVGSAEFKDIDISDIPSYIKYTSSGLTPSYYDNALDFKYKNTSYLSNIKSLNEKLLTIKDDNGKKRLSPSTSFIYENIKTSESNIAVLQMTLPDSLGRIIHPIIMYLDTYGNEAINGWDGTALDTGNGEYVFAPQVGAGEKDSANRFTGVVMGKDSGQQLIGLYGYQAGINTFGLMQDGRAFFGAKSGGGQIVINGHSGVIHGGDVTVNNNDKITPAENGMYLRLANKKVLGTEKAIGIGYGTHTNADGKEVTEENFFVTYDGKLKATEADIHGNIYANHGQIGGTARSGGWTITTNRLYSGSGNNTVALGSDPNSAFRIWAGKAEGGKSYNKDNPLSNRIDTPAKFVVTKDGYVYMNDCFIKGRIESDEGLIGGWLIKNGYLQDADGKVGMASRGTAAFWAGSGLNSGSGSLNEESSDSKFLVTRSGKLYCTSANISGRIVSESGKIGGWTINSNSLQSENGSIKLYASGEINAGNGQFKVDKYGKLTAKEADIKGKIESSEGKIGGWTINSNSLSGGNTILYSDGTINTEGVFFGNKGAIGLSGSDINIVSTNDIILTGRGLEVLVNAQDQHGIYARFA